MITPQRAPDAETRKPRVLFVDDEYALLAAAKRVLRSSYDVTIAEGGLAGIAHAMSDEPFATVCTDMRMPEADGLAVLAAFKEHKPDTTRMLFTGFAEIDAAMSAINEGHIFRFLTKPTDPVVLRKALDDAIEMNRIILAERELLEHTLSGAVEALLQTLALAKPEAFARASRMRAVVASLMTGAAIDNRWEIEVAATLSQVGAVTLPPNLLEKLERGAPLNEDEAAMTDELPRIADQLLKGIPRLEGVRQILLSQTQWDADDAPLGSKLLRMAADLDGFNTRKYAEDVIANMINEKQSDYGLVATHMFMARQARNGASTRQIERVPFGDLRNGMELAADIRTTDGVLLAGRGLVVNDNMLQRVENFAAASGLEDSLIAIVAEQLNPAVPESG